MENCWLPLWGKSYSVDAPFLCLAMLLVLNCSCYRYHDNPFFLPYLIFLFLLENY
jgi:hypothetical protein